MDVKDSQNIIKKNNFVPRKVSKKIINFINLENNYHNHKKIEMSKYITLDKLNEIRKKFQKFKKFNKIEKVQSPRNSLLYKYIKLNNPKIDFNYNDKKSKIVIPEINGVRLSLSTLLLNSEDKKKEFLNDKIKLLLDFKNLLSKCNFKTPDPDDIDNLINLLVLIKNKNKTLYIVTPACPDYSTLKDGNMYRYTFKSIGTGIGLVAERLNQEINRIHSFFVNNKIKFKHVIAVGDFEAFSLNNQKRLSLSEKNFLDRVKQNQKMIRQIFAGKDFLVSKIFTDYFNGKKEWLKLVSYYKKILLKGDYDNSILNDKKFSEILDSRLALYEKWYGNLDMDRYKKILIDQAAEYATMGYLIKKNFNCSIVLGADHFKMAPFYNISKNFKKENNLPVFYLRKNYYT